MDEMTGAVAGGKDDRCGPDNACSDKQFSNQSMMAGIR